MTFIALVTAFFVFARVSFGWFASSTNVSGNGMSVQSQGTGYLQIRASASGDDIGVSQIVKDMTSVQFPAAEKNRDLCGKSSRCGRGRGFVRKFGQAKIGFVFLFPSTIRSVACGRSNNCMNEEFLTEKQNLKISILGDSISTYDGWNPYGYAVYYKDDRAYENGIISVDDAWWKQVIDAVGGELCVNNSFSGSFVSDGFAMSACREGRCSFLDRGEKPDVILVYMGTNDRGCRVEIGRDQPDHARFFYGGYRTMLKRLKANYSSAKIVCATLPIGYRKNYENVPMSTEFSEIAEEYNGAIRKAVEDEDCLLADIALSGERYETLDWVHPTERGHKTLAKLWMERLDKII